jgi:galactose mutarotase-like enzyme
MWATIFAAALVAAALPLWSIVDSAPMEIGGAPVVTLTRPQPRRVRRPQFVEATVLPGEGMNLFQVKAAWPGKGVNNSMYSLMYAPDLAAAKSQLEGDKNAFGNVSFTFGGAMLLPFANRIRGVVAGDKKTVAANIGGQEVTLVANWKGKGADAEVHAIHGFIYSSRFTAEQHSTRDSSSVEGKLEAGNFGGHWPSQTEVVDEVTLRDRELVISVTAKNVGKETLPMAIGMHPYFAIPSGDREQARLELPAAQRELVNNYDDVFPTGQMQAVKGTPYDFNAAHGVALGKLYLDDSFTDLQRNRKGNAVIELIDPAAHYGLRITTASDRIRAVQVYAPPDHNFVAIEPQFNLADPFDTKIWGKTDTGVDYLAPGESAHWEIRLELFVPAK